jgi:hypothetical protein
MSHDWREEESEDMDFDLEKGRKGKVFNIIEEEEDVEDSASFPEEEDADLIDEEDEENSFALYDATEDEEFGYQM